MGNFETKNFNYSNKFSDFCFLYSLVFPLYFNSGRKKNCIYSDIHSCFSLAFMIIS